MEVTGTHPTCCLCLGSPQLLFLRPQNDYQVLPAGRKMLLEYTTLTVELFHAIKSNGSHIYNCPCEYLSPVHGQIQACMYALYSRSSILVPSFKANTIFLPLRHVKNL